jgi:hypothetical protein
MRGRAGVAPPQSAQDEGSSSPPDCPQGAEAGEAPWETRLRGVPGGESRLNREHAWSGHRVLACGGYCAQYGNPRLDGAHPSTWECSRRDCALKGLRARTAREARRAGEPDHRRAGSINQGSPRSWRRWTPCRMPATRHSPPATRWPATVTGTAALGRRVGTELAEILVSSWAALQSRHRPAGSTIFKSLSIF